jgi:tripartite-type tricarboxylate transporter receptor subunit TctC
MTLQSRRVALAGFAAFAACSLAPGPAAGQSYPSQPVKFIIPATAGGLPDTVARIVGRRLQERLSQSMVVENRPGGNGSVSVAALMSAPADGHSFIIQDGSIVSINPHLYANLSYKADDLVPVALIARAPLFLAAHPKVSVGTFKEFVDYAKLNPGKLNYGSSGVGSTHHLTMEALQSSLGLKLTHVPYKGTGESIPALLGGHIDVVFSAYPSLSGAFASKSVKMLATNGAQRSSQAPDVPPVADLIPGFDFAPIIGIYARAGTPPAAMQKIADEVALLVKEPEIIKQFGVAGIEAVGAGPAVYARELKSLSERVGKAVQAAGLKPQ